jgi:hypothetical protein
MNRRSTEQRIEADCSATQKQLGFLARNNLYSDHLPDFYEAMATINTFVRIRRQLAPTDKQMKLLKTRGKWREGMSRGEAHDLIRTLLQDDARRSA